MTSAPVGLDSAAPGQSLSPRLSGRDRLSRGAWWHHALNEPEHARRDMTRLLSSYTGTARALQLGGDGADMIDVAVRGAQHTYEAAMHDHLAETQLRGLGKGT